MQPTCRVGVAPHSLRAVPLRELKEIAAWTRERKLPLHMHVAEQIAENEACLREYGLTPVALLGREGLAGSGLHRGARDSYHRGGDRAACPLRSLPCVLVRRQNAIWGMG